MLSLRSLAAAAAVLLLFLALTLGDIEKHKLSTDSDEHLPDLQIGSEEHDSSSEDKIEEDKSLQSHDSDEHPAFHVHHFGGSWHPPRVIRPPLASLLTMPPTGVPVFSSSHILPSLPFSSHHLGSYIPIQPLPVNPYTFLPPGFGGVAPLVAPSRYYIHHHGHHFHHHYPFVANPHHFPLHGDARLYMASLAAAQHYPDHLFGHDHDHSNDQDLSDSHDGDDHDHDHDHVHGPHYHVHAYGPHAHVQAHYPNYPGYPYGPHFHAHAHYSNYPGYAYGPHVHAYNHYPVYPGYAYGPHFHAPGHYPNYPGHAYGPHFHAHAPNPNYPGYASGPHFHAYNHYPVYPGYAYGPHFHAPGHYPNYPGYAYGPHFHVHTPNSNYPGYAYGLHVHAQAPNPNYPGYVYDPYFQAHGYYSSYPAYAYGSHFHAYAHDSDDGAYAYGSHFSTDDYDSGEKHAYGSHLDIYPHVPMSMYPYGSAYHDHDVHIDWPMQYEHMWPVHPDHYDSYHKMYWNQEGQCSWENPMPCWGVYTCVPLSAVCDGRVDCSNGMDEDAHLCITGKRPNLQVMTYFLTLPDQAWMIKKLFNNREPVYVAMALKFAVNMNDLKWALSLDEEALNNTRALFQAAMNDDLTLAKNLDMKEENWPATKLFFRKIMEAGFNTNKN